MQSGLFPENHQLIKSSNLQDKDCKYFYCYCMLENTTLILDIAVLSKANLTGK
jgi:hypothetical protein